MLKLKAQVVEKLSDIIVEKHLPSVVKGIEAEARLSSAFEFSVLPNQSKCALRMSIPFDAWNFEEVEELKPNVWYPRGKFDGNPKNYIIVERTQQGVVYANYKDTVFDFTHHFMYIEPLGENK